MFSEFLLFLFAGRFWGKADGGALLSWYGFSEIVASLSSLELPLFDDEGAIF